MTVGPSGDRASCRPRALAACGLSGHWRCAGPWANRGDRQRTALLEQLSEVTVVAGIAAAETAARFAPRFKVVRSGRPPLLGRHDPPEGGPCADACRALAVVREHSSCGLRLAVSPACPLP